MTLHDMRCVIIMIEYFIGNQQCTNSRYHYGDIIISAMASQITNASVVCSTVCSDTNERKHQSSASLASVRGIHRSPVDSPHKVKRKIFPLMTSPWYDVLFIAPSNKERVTMTMKLLLLLLAVAVAVLVWVALMVIRDHSGHGLGQWEKASHSNASSHSLNPYLEWSMVMVMVMNELHSSSTVAILTTHFEQQF